MSDSDAPDEPRGEEPETGTTPTEETTADATPADTTPAAESAPVPAETAEEPARPGEPAQEDIVVQSEQPPTAQDETPEAERVQDTPVEPTPAEPTPAEPTASADEDAEPETPAQAAVEERLDEMSAQAEARDDAADAAQTREDEEEEFAPRVRPEIPGADLVPDIVPEGEEYLDAEARAAAEAEAEAAAARAAAEGEEEHAQPIADAAIDLASGARYVATGKRKTAVARVILKPGTGTYLINDKQLDDFFPRATLQRIIRQPLETVGYEARMDVIARMHGGGVAAQAGALRHGISRALLEADPNLRGELKRRGFLTRDPRVKERKKAGLKKARKRPQFSKR